MMDGPRNNGDSDIRLDGSKSRRANRINIPAHQELLLYKRLYTCTASSKPAVSQADDDPVSRIEVAIDDVDDDCLLKRSLVALLIETHGESLHSRSVLAWQERAGYVLCGNIIVFGWIGSLKERPVLWCSCKLHGARSLFVVARACAYRVKFEGPFDPGTVS